MLVLYVAGIHRPLSVFIFFLVFSSFPTNLFLFLSLQAQVMTIKILFTGQEVSIQQLSAVYISFPSSQITYHRLLFCVRIIPLLSSASRSNTAFSACDWNELMPNLEVRKRELLKMKHILLRWRITQSNQTDDLPSF